MIHSSVEKIEGGSGLVQTAGTTMNEIVEGVRSITSVIAEITVAAKEQSTGIEQVNQAVSHLDNATQQNAALVEQSAAAATLLREQAARLAQTVGEFARGPPRDDVAVSVKRSIPGASGGGADGRCNQIVILTIGKHLPGTTLDSFSPIFRRRAPDRTEAHWGPLRSRSA